VVLDAFSSRLVSFPDGFYGVVFGRGRSSAIASSREERV
jgi:hypothetical protein